jgi:hypothetical protein
MTLPRFRPVITLLGFAVLIIAVVILFRSLSAQNAYEILLSTITLLLLIGLGIQGAWKSRKFASLEPGWKPPFPMTANAGEETLITGLDAQVPLFFRLHFIVRGRFFPVGSLRGSPLLVETSVPRGIDAARLDFDLPMSGVFQGEGSCRLRDIFGFFSFPCGVLQQRTVKVRSGPCSKTNFRVNAQSGAEDRRTKNASNAARYYMRAYTPGDRFRAINWKSSEKIATLITRISPDNQEKVSRIEVYLRNYGPSANASLEALWLLDRAKARLSRFIRSLKDEQSSYVFAVRAAQGSWEIEDQDDVDAFLEELSGISFSPPKNEMGISLGALGELYVFSTACDIGLRGFLLSIHPRPVSLYLTQPARPDKKKDAELLRVREFAARGCIPSPRWFFSGAPKRLVVPGSRTEINYAGTKL